MFGLKKNKRVRDNDDVQPCFTLHLKLEFLVEKESFFSRGRWIIKLWHEKNGRFAHSFITFDFLEFLVIFKSLEILKILIMFCVVVQPEKSRYIQITQGLWIYSSVSNPGITCYWYHLVIGCTNEIRHAWCRFVYSLSWNESVLYKCIPKWIKEKNSANLFENLNLAQLSNKALTSKNFNFSRLFRFYLPKFHSKILFLEQCRRTRPRVITIHLSWSRLAG